MADFVVDRALLVLIRQVNEMAPNRSKASDGTIGDADHATRVSAHNPESPPPAGNPDDQVDAADITHDPAHGADMGEVTEAIRLSRDRRIRLVIFKRRIFSSYDHGDGPAWTWRPYYGENPHDKHAHVEVNDVYHDQTQPWSITMDLDADIDFTALKNRVYGLQRMMDPINIGLKDENGKPRLEVNELARTLRSIEQKLDTLLAQGPGDPVVVPATVGTFTGTVTYQATDGSA